MSGFTLHCLTLTKAYIMDNWHPLYRLLLDPTIQDGFNAVAVMFYAAIAITIISIILERKIR